jgi:hypothetical protein
VRFIRSSFYSSAGDANGRTHRGPIGQGPFRQVRVGQRHIGQGRVREIRAGGGEQVAEVRQQRHHLFRIEDGRLHEQGRRSRRRQRRVGLYPLFDGVAVTRHVRRVRRCRSFAARGGNLFASLHRALHGTRLRYELQ